MKTLIDNQEVTSRSYYYLLDFNEDNDWKELSKFGVEKLYQLNLEQYKELFRIATEMDIKTFV